MKDDKIKITQLPSLAMVANNFSLAVQNRRYVCISGGINDNLNQPLKKVTILDTVNHRETDLPDLNQERFCHSSIVLADSLFVFGGMINSSEYSETIECLTLQSNKAWITLFDSSKHVGRINSAIAAISAT